MVYYNINDSKFNGKVNVYRRKFSIELQSVGNGIEKEIITTAGIYFQKDILFFESNSTNIHLYINDELYKRIGGELKTEEMERKFKKSFQKFFTKNNYGEILNLYIDLIDEQSTEWQNAIKPDVPTNESVANLNGDTKLNNTTMIGGKTFIEGRDIIGELNNLQNNQNNNSVFNTQMSVLDTQVTDEDKKAIWRDHSRVKLFISYCSEYKTEIHELSEALSNLGISCFVAHRDIHGAAKWPDELKYALKSMDAFLACITDDFSESDWTDQETGFAFAKDAFIIPVQLGSIPPYGFIKDLHAIPGDLNRNSAMVKKIYNTILQKFQGTHTELRPIT